MAAFQDAVAGAIGAVSAELSTYPLGVVKTRLQVQRRCSNGSRSACNGNTEAAGAPPSQDGETRAPYRSTADCLRRIVAEEGTLRLYSGWRTACLKAALTNFVFFYNLRVASLLVRSALLQGMLAGLVVQGLTLPVDLVVTRMQSMRGGSAGFLSHVLGIVREEGVFGLWAGLGPGAALVLNPGITNMLFERLGGSVAAASALRVFLSGAAAKAVASLITYPYMRAKVQMQVQGMLATGAPRKGMLQLLMAIVDESGLVGLFDGFLPQVSNAVLKDALLSLIRVKIAAAVVRTFALLDRRRPAGRRVIS